MLPASRKHEGDALRRAAGRNVKVAVVDSGINGFHSHIGHVSGGVSITCDQTGTIIFEDDYRDYLGHGTAVAGIIRAKAPCVRLYSVKVLHEDMRTQSRILSAAIRSCIANDIRVINMSLGTRQVRHVDELRQACEAAVQRNVIMIAAGGEEQVFPAYFPCVIGVSANERHSWDEYGWLQGREVEFSAHAWPRPLPGLSQKHNLHGHSMATAHITSLVARILELDPQSDVNMVRNKLIQHCAHSPEAPSNHGCLRAAAEK